MTLINIVQVSVHTPVLEKRKKIEITFSDFVDARHYLSNSSKSKELTKTEFNIACNYLISFNDDVFFKVNYTTEYNFDQFSIGKDDMSLLQSVYW